MIIENMPLLEQASSLVSQDVTIESARQLAALEKQAKGEEAKMIGELWEALHAKADEELLLQLLDEEL